MTQTAANQILHTYEHMLLLVMPKYSFFLVVTMRTSIIITAYYTVQHTHYYSIAGNKSGSCMVSYRHCKKVGGFKFGGSVREASYTYYNELQ